MISILSNYSKAVDCNYGHKTIKIQSHVIKVHVFIVILSLC